MMGQVFSLSAIVATVLTQARAFVQLLRDKQVDVLAVWLESAQASSVRELRQFAQGLERDRSAVEAALSRTESNGQVEGHITRLKLIKRQTYGRAKFPLLRQRVLHAA